TTRSNQSGLYLFPNLPPGHYRMSVKHPGFKESVQPSLTLHVQDAVSQNFNMQVGGATESVTVMAEAQAVNLEDASVGAVVERQLVENMPLNGRSFQGLITLTAGVATVPAGINTPGQFVVNGQRTDTNYFTVDETS